MMNVWRILLLSALVIMTSVVAWVESGSDLLRGFCLLTLIVAGWHVWHEIQVGQQIDRLRQTILKLSDGQTDARLLSDSNDEMGQLIRDFNVLQVQQQEHIESLSAALYLINTNNKQKIDWMIVTHVEGTIF